MWDIQRQYAEQLGCNQRLFELLLFPCGHQPVCPFWSLTPDISKAFFLHTPNCLSLTGYLFCFLELCRWKPLRWLRCQQNATGSEAWNTHTSTSDTNIHVAFKVTEEPPWNLLTLETSASHLHPVYMSKCSESLPCVWHNKVAYGGWWCFLKLN